MLALGISSSVYNGSSKTRWVVEDSVGDVRVSTKNSPSSTGVILDRWSGCVPLFCCRDQSPQSQLLQCWSVLRYAHHIVTNEDGEVQLQQHTWATSTTEGDLPQIESSDLSLLSFFFNYITCRDISRLTCLIPYQYIFVV